jgi:N-acetyl-gamma-glutamyl-phosphate reductase
VSAPLVRGIVVTAFCQVPASTPEATLRELPAATYQSERFVRVPAARLPEVVAVIGSNDAEVGIALGAVRGAVRDVTVFAALDNLVKGGAGQAIQSLNLMFGWDESLTLESAGLFP